MKHRKIALAGIGKIAIDQHIPAIQSSPDWELAALVSRKNIASGIEQFKSMSDMLAARPDIDTVSLCMPPVPRFEYAVRAIKEKRHVMLEKPPGATLQECRILEKMAHEKGVSIYATWHSREAAQVQRVRNWISGKALKHISITWREDVRRWHPGQEWIWQPGGMGVFDPGINALSILTEIIAEPVHVVSSNLLFPENCHTPIAVNMVLHCLDKVEITAEFDFREEGEQIWNIEIETASETLTLSKGGAELYINGVLQESCMNDDVSLIGEYPRLYLNMSELINSGRSDMDLRPMELAADAMLTGSREIVAPFYE